MNLILFEPGELDRELPRGDRRTKHIRRILKLEPGDVAKVGVLGGLLGTATLEEITDSGNLRLSFALDTRPLPLHPLDLVVGLTRPISARHVLREATALGVGSIRFVEADHSERSYIQSHLWTTDEAQDHLRAGAEQSRSTLLPDLHCGGPLEEAIETLPDDLKDRVALDNVEGAHRLGATPVEAGRTILAVGPERGWTDRERRVLEGANFTLEHIGPRALRTETACIAGLALVLASRGILDSRGSD